MEYKLIRSSRRTIGISVDSDGVTVRAPYRADIAVIDSFVKSKEKWIVKHLETITLAREEAGKDGEISIGDMKALAKEAVKYIPERVRYYASIVGVSYGRITIRNQKTRWGSCSSEGNLNFNCLLMLAPPDVIDCVVVHELCHRKAMNHSKDFYTEVTRVYPRYKECEKWLKTEGKIILMRASKI